MSETMKLFGDDWSRALCIGCSVFSIPPDWVLAVLALESGFNPRAAHASGARGLWQRMPDQMYQSGKPLVIAPGAPAPPGCITRNNRDAAGTIVGQTVWRLYAVTDPLEQLDDYFAWTSTQLRAFNVGRLRSREALYCVNLAPARLMGGTYTDETVLYAAPGAAYRQNAVPFGLDPDDADGALRMRNLAHGLDAAVRRCQARYDAEVTNAYLLNAGGPPEAA